MDGIISSMDMSLSKLQEIVKTGKLGVLQSMGSQKVGHDLVTEQQAGKPSSPVSRSKSESKPKQGKK